MPATRRRARPVRWPLYLPYRKPCRRFSILSYRKSLPQVTDEKSNENSRGLTAPGELPWLLHTGQRVTTRLLAPGDCRPADGDLPDAGKIDAADVPVGQALVLQYDRMRPGG